MMLNRNDFCQSTRNRISHGEGSAAPLSNVAPAGARRAIGKVPATSLLILGAAGDRRAPFGPFRAGGGDACSCLLPLGKVQPCVCRRQHQVATRCAV
jgi:hypothetical protein